MTVELSVADVREALAQSASDERGDGQSSTLLLGRIFHEVHAELVGVDPARSAFGFLPGLERDRKVWNQRLLDRCYRVSVGPRLVQHKGYLHATTEAVLSFWQAVQGLVDLVTEITWTLTLGQTSASWDEIAGAFQPEASLICELEAPGWSDSVRLTGVVDCLLRVPGKPAWCAVELKLGKSMPTLDLAQAALYHLIGCRLDRAGGRKSDGTALALIQFSPARRETVFKAAELREVQGRLLALIGKLAGVVSAPKHPSPARTDYGDLAEQVVRTYREYGRVIELNRDPVVGPRFLRFGARLGKGVRFEQIKSLAPEIGLRLGLSKDPIVSRAGGRLTLDLARPDPENVRFESIVRALPTADPGHGSSRLLVGVGIDGRARFADLADPINAHVLVAGTTGSGKTEWLRTAIASLLIANTPSTLRLVLLDPKQNAFTDLKQSPFLWSPDAFWVQGDPLSAGDLLMQLVTEMEARYRLLAEEGVDDLRRFLQKSEQPLPRIVLFCDEYYALLTAAAKEERKQIEAAVGLLGAKARASGIHLVLAMQQASRKVIQGSIDTNIPCRVALMTSSAIESRMVLQADGADQLTGYGDLLYKDIGAPVRLQTPYLEPADRARIFGRAERG